jgi:putative Holliday junction resolvase
MARILGIDHGTARIGLAISDELELVASPLKTLDAADEPLQAIAAIVRDKQVGRIVVGLPLRMSGEHGEAAVRVEKFVEALGKALRHELPIELVDERLSSVEAEASLSRAGITDRHARREVVDQLAAVVILQEYLNSQRGPAGFLLPDETFEQGWDAATESETNRGKRRRGGH